MTNSFNGQVNKILNNMHNNGGDNKVKGTQGEIAALAVCEKLYYKYGGILYHSYSYKVDKALPGNIKKEDGVLRCENLGDFTEIDILYVSPFRVIPIEVKSYHAKKIILTDDGIAGCFRNEKSPIHQNEMHCRHLLSGIFEALPDGNEDYIRPIVVFVDNCTIEDKRSKWQREYVVKSVLNNFSDMLTVINTPFNNKFINLSLMEDRLLQIEVSCEKKFPTRYV